MADVIFSNIACVVFILYLVNKQNRKMLRRCAADGLRTDFVNCRQLRPIRCAPYLSGLLHRQFRAGI